jgi:hypothetical protein
VNRSNAAFAVVVLGTFVVEGAVVRTLKGTVALDILVGTAATVPSIIGLVAWRRRHRSWIAVVSWTVPLIAWMALCLTNTIPFPASSAGAFAGALFALLMSGIDDVARKWYRVVLRSDLPSE